MVAEGKENRRISDALNRLTAQQQQHNTWAGNPLQRRLLFLSCSLDGSKLEGPEPQHR